MGVRQEGTMELPIVRTLKRELEKLQYELSRELPAKLEEARAHGDLRENAEYDAAKNRQGLLHAKVAQTQQRIRELSVYSLATLPRDKVSYGTIVTVEDVDSGEEIEYRIVFPEEVDAAQGHVSIGSPIGKALMNKEEGEQVVVQTPRGRKTYNIVALTTLHDLPEESLVKPT
jgi:transcription elongation factor GreA